MGLDTTHKCWSGSCRIFNDWRRALTRAAGMPPLDLFEGYFKPGLQPAVPYFHHGTNTLSACLPPIKWEDYASDPLVVLLNHSDCDGWIEPKDCLPIANRLLDLLPHLPIEWKAVTIQFAAGLRDAAENFERVYFQ